MQPRHASAAVRKICIAMNTHAQYILTSLTGQSGFVEIRESHMQNTWQLQEAKSKFSEVIDKALKRGPQIITRRGKETAVLLSVEDYKRLVKSKSNLVEFLLNSPLRGAEIDFERDKSLPRSVEL